MTNSLEHVVGTLNDLAPLNLAAAWDNVGLLIQGRAFDSPVRTIFMCIDLTPTVAEELLARQPELVIAYHPLIFGGLKRLVRREPKQAVILRLIRDAISLYSPHTALDATRGGVCDWLLDQLPPCSNRMPITPAEGSAGEGMGRRADLIRPLLMNELSESLKQNLGLEMLQAAVADRHQDEPIETVAVCPGAGGSLFDGAPPADLLVTGEMRHHDVLAHRERGTSVLLTNHTNCERGFLSRYRQWIVKKLPTVKVVISEADVDPLQVV